MTDGITPEERARFAADLAAVGVGPGERLAVAVSGGADSLALLLLAKATQGDVIAATVDHGLRPEAHGESRMVANVCAQIGVPHRHQIVIVQRIGQGVQAAAREARYESLLHWARRAGANALATAHHADDQAETFLMRTGRASGVAGLAGVRRRQEGNEGKAPIVRPLLGWRRHELAAIVSRAGLVPVNDPSNDDERFDRTFARRFLREHETILPPLRIAATAANLADCEEALGWAAARLHKERVSYPADGDPLAILDPAGLPIELLRRIVDTAFLLSGFRLRTDGGTLRNALPRGSQVMRAITLLRAGRQATLGRIKVSPGPVWRFTLAPPHRSG